MFVKNADLQLTRAVAAEWLSLGDDTVGAAGPFDGALAKFFTNDITPNQDNVLGDLTEAALGTAGIAVEFSAPVNLGANRVAKHANVDVIAGAAPTGEEIYGLMIVNAAEDTLLASYKFPSSKTIAIEGDFIFTELVLAFGFNLPTGL